MICNMFSTGIFCFKHHYNKLDNPYVIDQDLWVMRANCDKLALKQLVDRDYYIQG